MEREEVALSGLPYLQRRMRTSSQTPSGLSILFPRHASGAVTGVRLRDIDLDASNILRLHCESLNPSRILDQGR